MASHDVVSIICQALIEGGIIRAPAPVPAAVGLATGATFTDGSAGLFDSLQGQTDVVGDGGVGGSGGIASGIGSPYTRASRSLSSGSGVPSTALPVSPVTTPRQSVDGGGGGGRACHILSATLLTCIVSPRVLS
jgi:hypothetical protein